MSERKSGWPTWPDWAIAAGLTIVIVVGAFAISGHNSVHKGEPTIIGGPYPTATSTSPAATPSPTRHSPKPSATAGGQAASPQAPVPTSSSEPTTQSTSSAQPTPTSSQTASAAIPKGVLGTFSYTTTGSEQTNIPGTKRTFPKTTTITNTKQGCGVLSTWKPVDEHVQSQLLCPSDDGIKVVSYKTSISFFGISSGENFKCSGDSFIYRHGVKAGDVWKYKCKSPDAVASQKARAIGFSTMSVGGTDVRVLHVQLKTKLTGDSSGKSTQDYWIATKKPVLVKQSGSVDATQQGVHYTESYSLTLDSLTPKA